MECLGADQEVGACARDEAQRVVAGLRGWRGQMREGPVIRRVMWAVRLAKCFISRHSLNNGGYTGPRHRVLACLRVVPEVHIGVVEDVAAGVEVVEGLAASVRGEEGHGWRQKAHGGCWAGCATA